MGSGKLGEHRPILITGAARSGTSLTAGIISICGAWGGNLVGPTRYNKRGMFENVQIRNDVVKQLLISLKYDPLGQKPLPDIDEIRRYAFSNHVFVRNQILTIINHQGYKGEKPWFYKGAKMCLIWPLWFWCFQKAVWVVVRRNKADIVNSCLKTGFMRKCDGVSGWSKWVDWHLERFKEMDAAGLDICEIWPQKIINGDLSEIKSFVLEAGLEWREDKVMDFISPALWSRNKIKN